MFVSSSIHYFIMFQPEIRWRCHPPSDKMSSLIFNRISSKKILHITQNLPHIPHKTSHISHTMSPYIPHKTSHISHTMSPYIPYKTSHISHTMSPYIPHKTSHISHTMSPYIPYKIKTDKSPAIYNCKLFISISSKKGIKSKRLTKKIST